MSLTRAQLLMGNVGQGTVIPGQVQGVKQGTGVVIASDGTISFDSETSVGVVKTNNEGAFNGYIWPSSTVPGSQLILGNGGNLSWVVRLFGFGLDLTGENIKVSLPIGTFTDPSSPVPPIGSALNQAIDGSLYWNNESDQLFICVGGSWVPASYGPSDINEALLTGTYTLYVNPEIGSDIYVTGIYNPDVTPVVTNQMVTAGYSPQKPFKTLQRAALEVARFQGGPQPDALSYDRFVIKCSTGEHIIDNTPGSTTVTAWVDDTVPSTAQLRAMNNNAYAGIILPRGVSVIGEDLRKTIIRPTYVPPKSGNIETARGSILRITGGGFFFNFTFKDKLGLSASHHLLDCFSFVSDTDLVNYYSKVRTIFGQDFPDIPVNPGETEIVAPQPPGTPTEATDGILGSSPYIFNCSVRSDYGICGINADGDDVSGFKSLVTAQFTGVSLQRDLYCWQQYNQSTKVWENTISSYNGYVILDPNSLRMDPNRRTYHIRAINGAFIQEVSVFAIGQGIHHWVKSGGEVSITNSNSSFGGCAALAEGYKTEAFPQDSSWNVGSISVATNMTDQTTVVSTIPIGVVADGLANNSTTIVLTQPLVESEAYLGTPEVLASRKYSFKPGSYLWVENPTGPDWRAPLTSAAWDPEFPDMITIAAVMGNQDGDTPGQDDNSPDLAGRRVYIRRLLDNRTISQRKYSLELTNTDINVRTPPRDYVIQTAAGVGGGVIQQISDSSMTIVNQSGPIPIRCADPVVKKSQVVLGRSNPPSAWVSQSYYRPGDTVRYLNKHFTCVVQNSDFLFDPDRWSESFVHMGSEYNAYDFALTIAPIIYFDNDTDGSQPTSTCGFNLATCWDLADIRAQYTTTTDYRGVRWFLIGMGFTSGEALNILKPRTIATRKLNPASSIDMGGYIPNGAANSLGNWPVEFRRPSVLRMFGHAWEWAGYLNYTKALPRYQGELSAQNQFSYYFTNNLGGRVYATGFNQEGYFVTAAGLTDLGTGATIGITDIGNPFADTETPTYFPFLRVDNLEVTTNLNFTESNLTGSPTFDPAWYTNFRQASTTTSGTARLADAADYRSTSSIGGTTDTERNASIDAEPYVVTAKGLNYWKNENRLVSARTGVQFVYVDPINGRNVSNINTLLAEPPVTQAGSDTGVDRANAAVRSLRAASDYANQAFGPTTTVEFRCGPGVYLDTGRITFSTVTRIRAWDFSANNYLNDSKAGGTRPFMGSSSDGATWTQQLSYFLNPANHPVFLTRPEVEFPYSPENAWYFANVLTFRFEQRATVNGIVWWGPMHTITSTAVPDSFFIGRASVSSWRPAAIGDFSNSLNYFIREQLATSTSSEVASEGLSIYQTESCIEFLSEGTIANIAVSAIGPAVANSTGNQRPSIFRTGGDAMEVRGLWLIGNVNISSALSGAFPLQAQTTYQITGFSESLFGIDNRENPDSGITLNYNGQREASGGTGSNANYNFTWNNVHLVNNNLAYPSSANDTTPAGSGWTSIGPALSGVFGYPLFIGTTGGLFWHSAFLDSNNNRQGFVGKFGNYGVYDDSALNARTKGIATIRAGFELKSCSRSFFLRKAGTADEPTDSGYPINPGEVGADENFDALNVQVTPIARGVDVNFPTKIIQNIKI